MLCLLQDGYRLLWGIGAGGSSVQDAGSEASLFLSELCSVEDMRLHTRYTPDIHAEAEKEPCLID